MSNSHTSTPLSPSSPSPVPAEGLNALFRLFDSLLRLHAHDDVPVGFVQSELEHYSKHGDVFTDWARYAIPSQTHYTRNLVASSDAVEIIVLCWGPGQEARIHDHGGSHCFMVALEGEVVEKRFAKAIPDGPDTDTITLTNEAASPTAVPGTCPRLHPVGESPLVAGGRAAYISDKDAIHSVGNYSSRPAVTLHVYAPPITRVKVFDPEGNQVIARTPGFFSVHGRKTGKD